MKTPPLNIKDPVAYNLASELARLTGKSMTRVVIESLQNELTRHRTKEIDRKALRRLLKEIDSMPRTADTRTDDEILGYDEKGRWM